jgi:nucleoside-triphosphatase THEP1
MGQSGVGKSTAIRKAIRSAGVSPRGFLTYFGPDRNEKNRFLYMRGASEDEVYDEERVIARFDERGAHALPERFDAFAHRYIESVRSEAKLFVFDECSWLERDAAGFRRAVLESLDLCVPILGVTRIVGDSWTRAIVAHPSVEIIDVNPENRDRVSTNLTIRIEKAMETGGGL